jgi:hypothetical protein
LAEKTTQLCLANPSKDENPTPVKLFQWESASFSLHLVQPVRLLTADLTFSFGIEQRANGTFCARIQNYTTWRPLFGQFLLDLDSGRKRGDRLHFNYGAELQLRKGQCQLNIQLKDVALQ